MKVYVVTSGGRIDRGVDAVFLDKAKAKAYARYHDEGWRDTRVEPFETADDSIGPNPSGYLTFAARLRVPCDEPPSPDVDKPFPTLDDRSTLYAVRMADGGYVAFLRRSYPESSHTPEAAQEAFPKLASDELARLDRLARAGGRLDLIYPMFPSDGEDPE